MDEINLKGEFRMHQNVIKKLEELDESEGYFITITTLNDGKLKHYQRQEKFPKEDVSTSLEEIKKLVRNGLN